MVVFNTCISRLAFPFLAPEHNHGTYNGNEYFVIERISKTLSEVVHNTTLSVSRDDLINISIQILDILTFLFQHKKVLRNLHIRDFALRRTTKGFRVVLVNQDFVDE